MGLRHRACDTDKHRKLMKKQNAARHVDKLSREAMRHAKEMAVVQRRLLRRDNVDRSGYWENQRRINARRIRDLLLQRIRTIESAAPEPGLVAVLRQWFNPGIFGITFPDIEPEPAAGLEWKDSISIAPVKEQEVHTFEVKAEGAKVKYREIPETALCPLCGIPITPEHYPYNVDWVKFNGKMLKVHKVCPNEPGYVWLREGSPGSGRFA